MEHRADMGRALKVAVEVGRLASALGLELRGDPAMLVARADPASESRPGSICFIKDRRWAHGIEPSTVLLASHEIAEGRPGTTLICSQPRLDFARALALLEQWSGFVWSTDDPKVHASARIGRNVVLGRGVHIGAHTVIHHNVVIGDEVVIGERCTVKSCAVIGEEGFGFERDTQGRAVRLPHLGRVILGDDVEVGSLTTVCRGTLSDTVLRAGCKIDDHVHIAHNVDIGEDAFVIACAEVSGGVKIGRRAWIAPNASILNQLSVGADAIVGLGAVVVKSVPDGVVVAGNPAKPIVRKG
jgi:UDP-3-O-[3-hydroxymyristoyl] glucosamine N-acyltransferase